MSQKKIRPRQKPGDGFYPNLLEQTGQDCPWHPLFFFGIPNNYILITFTSTRWFFLRPSALMFGRIGIVQP